MKNLWQRVTAVFLLLCSFVVLLSACKQTEEPHSEPPQMAAFPDVDFSKFTKNIDFDALLEKNEDHVAWIVIPGTNIDYPVMYCADNSFYLTHDEDKEYYVGGSIFIDMSNRKDFQDPLTMIYGHLMPDETIFSQLHKYKDPAFFRDNPDILLYMPSGKIQYRVIAAFEIDDRNLLYQKNYYDENTRQEFINWIEAQHGAEVNTDLTDVTVADNFVALSTCQKIGGFPVRFLVVAKKVGESLG